MIPLLIALLVSQPIADRASAEREIASAESQATTALSRRLLESAREALAQGRYVDAIDFARRAAESGVRSGRVAAGTAVARPITEPMFEAISRLIAAENQMRGDARVIAARELYTAAEAELAAGNFAQADVLAGRVSLILGSGDATPRIQERERPQRLDVNSATPFELWKIPGFTQERLRNFLWFRRHIGPLRSLNEFRYIPGFDAEYVLFSQIYFDPV